MDRVVSLDPANVSSQRGLMFAYGHIGDVLGNPNLQNLGDSAGAMEAYRMMSGVARRIHEADPADQRARGDYAIALARVAATMPADRIPQRLALLRQSLQLHQEVSRVNPENLSNRSDMAFTLNLLGDSLQTAGDGAGAVRAWRDSLTMAEALISAGSGSAVLTTILLCRRLGEEAARRGDREAGLTYAKRALQLSDPSAVKGRPADLQRFITPRGFGAMGLAYAGLAGASVKGTAQSREDAIQARQWLEKSLTAWRAVQSHPSMSPSHRREVRQVETALAGLK
jgi:tetratricopeptide (TPR) repeat protein